MNSGDNNNRVTRSERREARSARKMRVHGAGMKKLAAHLSKRKKKG